MTIHPCWVERADFSVNCPFCSDFPQHARKQVGEGVVAGPHPLDTYTYGNVYPFEGKQYLMLSNRVRRHGLRHYITHLSYSVNRYIYKC